ncbi:hypothetical protein [Streptomyces sp. NPDC057002]|uniref:hypothetical protein n=1 Tax=Streptomyces sp. NPDC057002 TaxID=3345992 RepID=UPI003629B6AA
MSRLRTALRAAASATVLSAAVLTAPQAVAVEQPSVPLSAKADAETVALAQAEPAAAAAAANVCGTGYTLRKGVPLPVGTDPAERLGTLFSYENGGKGCVILDNNVGKAQYMYVQICKVGGTSCDVDSGNFSEYAGPVRVSSFACAPVTAKMGSTSSSLYINYKSDRIFPCG